ncbi:hypothetical protein [Budvicia aquatica]|uniref:Uncharacterized protein n=1 Tax=Budvicia aquatica TaxID=82979 RepID=A0A485A580_9GAMM|nr:hypothetical protein [Budvicia aquatica]VFS52669.1 Uncharacterised protein [Budvicia aquatica]
MMKKILLGAVLCGLSTYTCANDDIVFQCTLKQDREKIEVIRHDKGIYVSYMTPQEAKMDEGGRHLSLTLGSDIIEQSVAGIPRKVLDPIPSNFKAMKWLSLITLAMSGLMVNTARAITRWMEKAIR